LPVRSSRLEGVLESLLESNNCIPWSLANIIQTDPCVRKIHSFKLCSIQVLS
jgi:hypothetical protein